MADMVVFGHATEGDSSSSREKMVAFAVRLAKFAGLEVATCRAHNYTELADLVHKDKVDFAWLPPIPYLALVRHGRVTPLVSARRGGRSEFYCVIVVREDAPILNPRDLIGKRAAWVDPHSASGYVLPRIALSAVGVDPRSAFPIERFHASHEAALRAVLEKRADFASTYAWLDREGNVSRGAWLDVPEAQSAFRVLATFGAIPADVIAARSQLDSATRERITSALLQLAGDREDPGLLERVFGVDELRRGPSPGYAEFGQAVMRASQGGLLEGEEKGTSEA